MKKLFLMLAVVILGSNASSYAQSIKNPYYTTSQWKLWYSNSSSVVDTTLIAPGAVGQLTAPALDQRIYPTDETTGEQFVAYKKGDYAGRKYAGNWDDVYTSLDGTHTWLYPVYYNGINSADISGSIMLAYLGDLRYNQTPPLNKFGINFTSQSTTLMGSNIANGGNYYSPYLTESHYYFSNALRAGPSHDSIYDDDPVFMDDRYQAYFPVYFNSTASSGSEMGAVVKMILTGGSLPIATKNELKRNGLYITAILYIWKAAFPFDVPYDNELKHRVTYSSYGTGYVGEQFSLNKEFHYYDENTHMRRMIEMAKGMTVAPPVSLLKKVTLISGTERYFTKTTGLFHQAEGQQAQVRVSVADSFDIANRPLTFKVTRLYGNPATSIVNEGGGNYLVTVPDDPNLPSGRTTIIFVANNGVYDSNPAVLNIFKNSSKVNKRPIIADISDRAVLPGTNVSFNISSIDPDGYPTKLYKRLDQQGTITGTTYNWATTSGTPPGDYKVNILTSDSTAGVNSKVVTISVQKTIAKISANKTSGPAPLTVNFSSAGSADINSSALSYSWDFDNGVTSTQANPVYTFSNPGLYKVKLTATGPLGSHSADLVVEAKADTQWGVDINNGWNTSGVDSTIWSVNDAAKGAISVGTDGTMGCKAVAGVVVADPLKVVSAKSYTLPYYIETEFQIVGGSPGDGVELSGSRIGWDSYYASASPATIKNLTTSEIIDIGRTVESVRSGPEKVGLKVYVSADPKNSGKATYKGYLSSLTGNYFFRFDNQPYTVDKVKLNVVAKWQNTPNNYYKFRLLKPGGSPSPDYPPNPARNLRIQE